MTPQQTETMKLLRKMERAGERLARQKLWLAGARSRQQDPALAAEQRARLAAEETSLQKMIRQEREALHNWAKSVGLEEDFPAPQTA